MISRLKTLGTSPADSRELRLRKFTVLIIACTCCTAAPIWSAIYYFIGLQLAAFGPAIYFVLVVPAIVHFAITHRERLLINVQLLAIFICPLFMQWTSGGLMMGAGVILWSFLAPLSALLLHDVRRARIWFFLFVGGVVITAVCNSYFTRFGHGLDDTRMIMLITMNIIGPLVAVYFAMQYFVNTLNVNTALLNEEKQKSDKLLLNILPAQVAEELKRTGSASPMKFTASTVLFTDFKDFTKISEQLTPEELIHELDTCFKAFDDIISAHGLEKIKTIGDAYMCVAGIPVETRDGAKNAVLAALDIAGYVRKIKEQKVQEGKPYWDVRIGVHTGDVVAGIVGKNKFAYDIWGDAVNTASRMESSGEEGKVNISGVTYQLVQDHFHCIYRGRVPAKNKGEIDMYFVESINTEVTNRLTSAVYSGS